MKDEKKVQNNVEEVNTDNADPRAQLLEMLGVTLQSETEEVAEERSNFIRIPDMILECKTTIKNNRTFKDYILYGKLRGRLVEIRMRPGKNSTGFTDVNAYKLLDVVFGDSNNADFAVRVTRRMNTFTNRMVSTMEYVAYAKDEKSGFEYYAPLVFDTISDKAALQQLLQVSNVAYDLKLPV